MSARLGGDLKAGDRVRLEVLDEGQAVVAERSIHLSFTATQPASIRIDADIPDARLWSPETPYLYTARLTLLKGDEVIDRVESRFGIREIRTQGHYFLLNGKRLFLRGYGDDAVYPETMAPPADKQFYLKRLRLIKSYGFNFVRHHSHMLPAEYYEAADEVGMLVSAEFPIAYQEYFDRAKGPALELFKSEWAAAIRQLRNHPSILDWCMGNELYQSISIAPEMYATAKSLDPARLVIDSDGLIPGGFLAGVQDRATLDFYSVQFDAHNLPLDSPSKHQVPGTPKKPVVCHETGNYATFPRMSAIGNFTHNFKPFWLTPAEEKLRKLGLLEESQRWSRNSERLYLLCHKLNTEDLRKQAKVAGYTWWLFQDYWTGSNGIVDHYFRAKDIRPEEVSAFNSELVLLLDGLDVAYRSGQKARVTLLASNFSPEALKEAHVEWQAGVGDQKPLDWFGVAPLLEQGAVTSIQMAAFDMPTVQAPQKLTIQARLQAGARTRSNEWSAWVLPAHAAAPAQAVPLVAGADVADSLARYRPQSPTSKEPLPTRAVYVVSQPTRRILDAVAAGACALILDPAPLFPAVPNRFKPAWWLGNEVDSNTGTVVYDGSPASALAPEGWCDAGWYHLLEGSMAAVLDELPAAPEVLVRALDVHTQCRSKAVLFQARVGKGCIIVSGLNFGLADPKDRPERQWLLDRLVEYAGTFPRPKAELPMEWLRGRSVEAVPPEGPVVNGFALVVTNEGEQTTYANYRGAPGPIYVCRQTTPGRRVEWETAPVAADWRAGTATFRFAGGLGWRSQPKTEGFRLLVDGRELLAFDVTRDRQIWRGADGRGELLFVPRRTDGEDAMGLFYLTLPADMVRAGQPCRLAVLSKGESSRRWFGLTP